MLLALFPWLFTDVVQRYYSAKPSASTNSAGGSQYTSGATSAACTSTCTSTTTASNTTTLPPTPPTDLDILRHDPTLTAYAQLACHRLNCPRAVLSLIDHEYQYVIAEATETVSLANPLQTDAGDQLWGWHSETTG
jgi:hypothetical protein